MKKKLNLKHKIINNLIKNGNKTNCEKIFLKTTKNLQKNLNKNHSDIIKLSVINSAPIVRLRETRKKKRKTITYLPYVVTEENRILLAIKAIIRELKKTESVKDSLKRELLSTAKNDSIVIKKKSVNHKSTLAKKKYVFFRWFF